MPSTANGFLGSGDLYIQRYVAGVLGDLKGPYYASKFEIKPNVEKKTATSKGKYSYGQVIASASINQAADLNVELSQVDREGLALALLGTQAALTQGSGTLTAVNLPAVVLDAWLDATKQALTGTMTVTNAGATVTYVEGTDYILNRQLGLIKFLSTGAVLAGAVPKISGAYSVIAGTKISGGTQTSLLARFILDGQNQVDGSAAIVRVWQAQLAASSAFDFLANDFGAIQLSGSMNTPVGYTEPFVVELP